MKRLATATSFEIGRSGFIYQTIQFSGSWTKSCAGSWMAGLNHAAPSEKHGIYCFNKPPGAAFCNHACPDLDTD